MDQDFYMECVRSRLPEDVAQRFEQQLGQMVAQGSSAIPDDQALEKIKQAGYQQGLTEGQAQGAKDGVEALKKAQELVALEQTKRADGLKASYDSGFKDGVKQYTGYIKPEDHKTQLDAAYQRGIEEGKKSAQPVATNDPAAVTSPQAAPVSPSKEPAVSNAPVPPTVTASSSVPPATTPPTAETHSAPSPASPPAKHNPLAGLFGRKG